MNKLGLAGRNALVTGGSRGVGAATALMLAEHGANVAIGFRERAEAAESVVAQMAALGVRACAHPADISTPDGARKLFDGAAGSLGPLNIFVGNAGIWPEEPLPVSQLPDSRWNHTLRQNLDSVFYTSRLAAERLVVGGRIVLVSSTAGQRGESYHADYAATKGAVISLVKSLAVELAQSGTTVNCVAPGWIDTEMVDSVRDEGSLQHIANTIPVGRVATADDVAGPIVFLCSALARHITGEVLNVNGGSVLCG
jgi:3-oxoacyl-[acyl-carrier protein] reductase